MIKMENQEDGCHHRSECINAWSKKCLMCSAHYTSEFKDRYESDNNEN